MRMVDLALVRRERGEKDCLDFGVCENLADGQCATSKV